MPRRVFDPSAPLRKCRDCSRQFNPYYFPYDGCRCRRCHSNHRHREYTRSGRRKYDADSKRRSNYRLRYGVELEWVERRTEELGGLCSICREEPTSRKLMVDHCHATGAVRDLLCVRCNNTLGWVGDSVDVLQRMIEYLERYRPK